MNILLINHYAGSPRHGMEFRPYYLAREWVRMGHNVRILGGSYSHIRAQQPPVQGTDVLHEDIDGVRYTWYPTYEYEGNGVGRVFSMLSFLASLWKNGKQLAREVAPDIVIASSTYPMDIWPAQRIARMAGARLVYEVHDLWPLSPIELGGMSRLHPFILWVQMAEDYAYRRSDKVVSLLPKTLKYMQGRGMDPDKFVYVPNGIDEQEWENPLPLPPDILGQLQRIHDSGLPIVGYAGTHGVANALDDFLDVARRLQGKVQFVLVGTGPERDRLQGRVASEQLANVHMLPAVPKRAVPTLLRYFDIAYVGFQSQPLYRFGISPNKLIDYMSAARPVVMAIDAGNDPVGDAGAGITVGAGDINGIVSAIERLIAMPLTERESMGVAGRNYIHKYHLYPVLARRFIDALM